MADENGNGKRVEPPVQMTPGNEQAFIHISLFPGGKIGVNYPKDIVLAIKLMGEAVKVLGGELQKMLVEANVLNDLGQKPLIEVPRFIPPKLKR